MKIAIASVACLAFGLGIGWFLGHRAYDRHITNEAVSTGLEAAETSDAYKAALGARAIECTESGETQQAVQLLSTPIAHYYTLYGDLDRSDERSAKLRKLIEQLASTNPIVAARIAESSNAARIK